jgi:two-component system cell cycle sensor histidine kinase/response regulator CckA
MRMMGTTQTTQTTRKRILIVEDELLMRDFIDRLLRDAGYSTARVVDGQEALELAELCGPFDLLLTDLVMPRIGGTELARRLRRIEPNLKVVYFTGYPDRLLKDKCGFLENEALVEKSSPPEGLLQAVSLLLSSPRGHSGHRPAARSARGFRHRH